MEKIKRVKASQLPDATNIDGFKAFGIKVNTDGTIDNVKVPMDLLKGNKGDDGTVAFEELTEEQRLSLKGEKGDKGDKGDKGEGLDYNTMTPEEIENIKGVKGDKGDKGDTGEQGIQGIQGVKGDKGDPGVGLPIGGTTGQQLMKKSDIDYDFEWQTPLGSGDMLKSVYDTDGDGVVDNAEKVNGFTVETNVPANAEFTDTVYTHPASHPATIITEDASHRFVTDTEKSTWNAKMDADKFQVVSALPASPVTGVFYFIKE